MHIPFTLINQFVIDSLTHEVFSLDIQQNIQIY
jgi:hypothetical protein